VYYNSPLSIQGDVDKTQGNNGRILTANEILKLEPKQCLSKVLQLQKYLKAKSNLTK